MKICGIDEAGRGSVLGPLVIAGVEIDETKLEMLPALGVTDSKKISSQLRNKIYKKLVDFLDSVYVIWIHPRTIDKRVTKHELNHLEAQYIAKIISNLKPNLAYVDSFDVNPTRLSKKITKMTRRKVIASHKADEKFPIVSAASIIAKVKRDQSIKRLKKKYKVGSGYPIDSKTVEFLSEWFYETDSIPHFARKSWKTTKRISKSLVLP